MSSIEAKHQKKTMYNRLLLNGGNGSPTASPPASPIRSPRVRPSRSYKGARSAQLTPLRTLPRRIAWKILSFLLRRQAILLFFPLIYTVVLVYMGSVSLDVVPRIISRPPPGSVYRSPQLYRRLRQEMDSDNSSDHTVSQRQLFMRIGFLELGVLWDLSSSNSSRQF